MKFANYKFSAKGVNNLGDNMQIIAIDEIYRSMGVNLRDIVYINTNELSTYKGEYVILPVTMPLVDYQEGGISGRFSPHIIPVFLGLTMVKDTLEAEEIAYYKKFEPIGCRDERTLNTLRKYQIQSYLHGCITVTFPKRQHEPSNGSVYIVDVNEQLQKKIPTHLRENAIYRTHLRTDHLEDPKEVALTQYYEYKNNASLVITSLLHCAVPCMAAGIPVIMLKKVVSYRMAWLEKLLPIYTPSQMDFIDWDAKPVELEQHKANVLSLTCRRLKAAFDAYAEIFDLSWFYENRKKSQYINDACQSLQEYIDTHWTDYGKNYLYAIWGMTQIAEWVVNYISRRYPNAKLNHVYDTFRTARFKGLQSVHPSIIADFPEEFVFVTAIGVESAARELFAAIKKPVDHYAFQKLVQ